MSIFNNYPAEVFILLFLILTFLYSGLEKLLAWKDNVDFLKEQFKNTPVKNMIPILMAVVLITEKVAAIAMIFGLFAILTTGNKEIALIGTSMAALILLLLLFGQRLAKDYAGSVNIAVYFIITVAGIYLLNQ